MRISDWSSDVCSSDLGWLALCKGVIHIGQHLSGSGTNVDLRALNAKRLHQRPGVELGGFTGGKARHGESQDSRARETETIASLGRNDQGMGGLQPRSEEHTPELQSLMPNSYAVF